MFVPLFPFPVPIPLIGEQLLPLNRPALLCMARTPHRACSSFLLDKGKAIGSPSPLSGAEGSSSPHLPRISLWRVLLGGAATPRSGVPLGG